MSDEHVLSTIEMVQTQVRELERQIADKRRVVDDLCKLIKRSPIYGDAQSASAVVTSIRPDEFYGKPLAAAVRSILEKRFAANLGAAAVADLYDALKQGGMAFEAKNDANAKRGLYISLGKNPIFHKLPNGTYGLSSWYPNMRSKREVVAEDEPEDRAAGASYVPPSEVSEEQEEQVVVLRKAK